MPPSVELAHSSVEFDPSVDLDRVIPAARVRHLQVRHVLLYNALPAVGFAVALGSMYWLPSGWAAVGSLAAMTYLTFGVGISVGYHRLFTHSSFDAPRPVRYALAALGSMAAQGPLTAWVATHRLHHQHSDGPGDPHSPHSGKGAGFVRGLWHAHAGWLVRHDMPNPLFYAKDVLQDRGLARVAALYPVWVAAGVIVPGLVCGLVTESWEGALSGLLWGGLARLFIGGQFVWSVNSLCHAYGAAPHDTGDHSTNNLLLALPTFGEAWHNNHHAYPRSAQFGLRWWQADIGWYTIWAMNRCGLARNVRRPNRRSEACPAGGDDIVPEGMR